MDDLLFLAHRIPFPPNKGDKLRSYHMLKYLGKRYRVHLGCFVDDPEDRKHLSKVEALCHETCFIDLSPMRARLRSLLGLASGEAMSQPYYRNAHLGEWVASIVRRRAIKTALAFSSPMAQYLQPLHNVRRIIDFVDVDSEKWRQYAQSRGWPLAPLYLREARRLLAYERTLAASFDAATFVSDAEAALFRRLAPESRGHVGHFCNGVDADYFSPHILHRSPYPPGTRSIVFTGAMDYWPNVEAVRWFAHNVFATLREQLPSLRFYIVGARPAHPVQALANQPGVYVTGSVADTRPFLAHATCAVAPLRIGRGVQNKVLEAMAMQKLIIVSPQALEGIHAKHGVELLVASDAEEYIARIRAVLARPVAHTIAKAARARVLKDYSWDVNLEYLGSLLAPPRHLVTECQT